MGRSRTRAFCALLLVVALAAGARRAEAAELQVLSAGAMRSIVTELAAAFEKETSNPVKLTFGTVGALKAQLADGAPADVVIMTQEAMQEMARQGAVVEGSWIAIGRTGIGVAVREGAPKPNIGTPEALKRTLLATKSLVYVDPAQSGTSGIHFAGVLQKLGIAEAVKPKTSLVPGGYPAELVAKGQVDLVVHQISEIVPVKGVTLVGPLPKELQKTTVYAAGITVASASRRPSASMLKPSTASRIASPGNTTTHGACSMKPRPSESISPSDGVGGRTPTPRNDSAASTRIAIAISTEA